MGYWCTEQLIVTVNGPAGRSVVSLSQPFARVGSHPEADVVIPDDSVARRSLYLHATPEGVFCLFLDVGSANPDERGRWLEPDQDVPVGAYRVRASLLTAEAGDAVPAEGLATWGSASPPLPVVMVYCGDLLKDKRRFRARLSPVGRRPQCGLQLKGKKVSSFHCVLYWDRAELWCIDLNSSNGTTLNGSPLSCSRVNIGDRLEVGEFGLVFERLSSGSQNPPRTSRSGPIPDQPPPRASREVPEPVPDPAASIAAPPMAEATSAAPAALFPIPADEPPAESAEQRRLREQLAEEVARLGREREALQARWDLASQQLQQQITELHDEAARLARERQALENARSQWTDERQSLTRQLTERAEKLAQLEVELTNTASALTSRLAEVEQQRDSSATAAPMIDEMVRADFAPAMIVAGLSDELPDQLAQSPDRVQQILPELSWDAASTDETDTEQAPTAPGNSASVEHLKAQWEETSERLRVQIEQLQEESAELLNQRMALERSRHEWQSERQLLTEQLTARTDQLAHLEADLAATSAAIEQRLAEVEQRNKPADVPPPDNAAPAMPPELAQSIEESWLSQIAPGAIVAGIEPDACARFAAEIAPEVTWSYTPTEPGAALPPLPDPQAEIQARWEATSQQLSVQVEQLRAEAAQLAADRQSLERSRAQWRAERQWAAELELPPAPQLPPETIPSAEADSCDLAPIEPAPGEAAAGPVPETAVPNFAPAISDEANPASLSLTLVGPRVELSDPGAPPVAGRRRDLDADDSDHLTLLVSQRLSEKHGPMPLRWLWWSAGGIALVAALAVIVISALWWL